jgi:hypothetical protein
MLDIVAHPRDRERVAEIRNSTGLISFSHEGGRSYDLNRARRLCRLTADTIDATPLTAPLAISKLRWRLTIEQRRGVNGAATRPERAAFAVQRDLHGQTMKLVATARLARISRAATDELLSENTRTLEGMVSETLRGGVAPPAGLERDFDNEEALVGAVLERICNDRLRPAVRASFNEAEHTVIADVFRRVAVDFQVAAIRLLRAKVGPTVSTEDLRRLLDHPNSAWAASKFSYSVRNLARQASSSAEFDEMLKLLIGNGFRGMTFDVLDAFRAARDGGCAPDEWAPLARSSASVLALPTALRSESFGRIFVEDRHAPGRKNPYSVCRDSGGTASLEPAPKALRSEKLLRSPGYCTAFQPEFPSDATAQGESPEVVRYIDGPLRLAIGVADYLRRTGRIFT